MSDGYVNVLGMVRQSKEIADTLNLREIKIIRSIL